MKVSDFMRTSVVTISPDDPSEKAVRYIFNLGIKSVPVVKNKKLVGIVTEVDLLQNLFPPISEFMEDRSRAYDFEGMEDNILELIRRPVSGIMNKKPRTVFADTPLLKAQSTMLLNQFSHLPVVDKKKHMVGIISQGDIFRAIVGQEIPYDDNEEYHAWLSRHWDLVVTWKRRLDSELGDFKSIFEKHDTYRVLDIFCGTGEHDIALAREGYAVTAMNKYQLMHDAAMKKYAKLPEFVQRNIDFRQGDYIKLLKNRTEDFDAAIFMGNSISHNTQDYKQILKAVSGSLTKKKAVVILQIANFEKILNVQNGLQAFNVRQSRLNEKTKYAFVEFYDPPKEKDGNLTLSMAILRHDDARWTYAGLNSTPIAYITEKIITKELNKVGFKSVQAFGSNFNEPLFKEKFKSDQHDWLNIVATR